MSTCAKRGCDCYGPRYYVEDEGYLCCDHYDQLVVYLQTKGCTRAAIKAFFEEGLEEDAETVRAYLENKTRKMY